MIQANHNWIGRYILAPYIRRILKKDFESIIICNNIDFQKDKSIMLFSNHISWWDGFFAHHIAENIFKKRIHVMMLEFEIIKNPILKFRGAFGIKKNSKDIINAFNYTKEILSDFNNLVAVFPQGKIESQLVISPILENGLFKLASQLIQDKIPIQCIQSTVFVDYLNHRKPKVFIYLNTLEGNNKEYLKSNFLENYYTNYLTQQQLSI